MLFLKSTKKRIFVDRMSFSCSKSIEGGELRVHHYVLMWLNHWMTMIFWKGLGPKNVSEGRKRLSEWYQIEQAIKKCSSHLEKWGREGCVWLHALGDTDDAYAWWRMRWSSATKTTERDGLTPFEMDDDDNFDTDLFYDVWQEKNWGISSCVCLIK